MKNRVKRFGQFINEDYFSGMDYPEFAGERQPRAKSSNGPTAAIIFDPNTGNLEIMFGNSFMHDRHGLEDAVNEGNEVHIVEYSPEEGGIYLVDGSLDLSGVKVLKTL